ncbi:MAG TPA: SDR family NAD(P)-dependent oxidoreductase [Burkholderiaceae bacterium]|nr:SDR family NAD(P)-dependent oxidoreductase [Burkholderiaceae bacterium]
METPADSERKPRGRKRFGRPRLLIVGCGDVGLRIVARLRDRFRIIATTATSLRTIELRTAGAVPLVVNLDIAHTVARLRGLSSRWIDLVPPPATGTGDPRTRRLRCACGAGIERAVYVSTTGVYGDRQGARLDETARPAPATERARRRLAAEAIVRRAPIHASVLRAPGIYAANRLPFDRLRAATPALRPEDDVYTNHIHADDLARAAVVALFRGAPARIYNAVDDTQLKMGEFFDRVAERFRLPRPPRLSRAMLQAAVSPAQYSFMSESRRLANRRLKRELRLRLAYPTVEAALAAMPD